MANGKYTIRDVAQLAGVSVGTASKVINGIYVKPAAKKKVEDAVRELGYIPNALARGLKGSATRTIGVMIPNIASPINSSVLRGISNACAEAGYSVLFSDFNLKVHSEKNMIRVLKEKQVDGVIYTSHEITDEIENALSAMNVPVVLLMTDSPHHMFSTVSIDNEGAAFEMTNHLIGKGHERILFLAGEKQDSNAGIPRLKGYRKALKKAGIPVDKSMILHGDYTFERGYEDMQRCLAEKRSFSAVFAAADVIAIGAMRALREAGHRIPEDFSVAGFDGISMANYMIPSLSTVAQPFKEYGTEGSRLLIRQIEEKTENSHIRLQWQLWENGSVGTRKARKK